MPKVLNILLLVLIIIFSSTVYKYYSSTIHFESRNFNRNNIDKIIKDKIADLPILDNDTNEISITL